MVIDAVNVIFALVLAYSIAGVLFAIAFALRGAADIDHAARGAPISFRLLIMPGAAALWPLLLRKWIAVYRRRGAS